MSFVNLSRHNTTFLAGHDFAAGPERALLGALRDVAQYGMGQVDNAFHEQQLWARYAVPINYEDREKDVMVKLDRDVLDLTDAVGSFTAHPSVVTTSGFVRIRNGEEGWHTDGTFDRDSGSTLHGSGLRLLMKLGGVESHVVAAAQNDHMVKLFPNSEDVYPKECAHFVSARYLSGSLILMPQSLEKPLKTTTTDAGLTAVESPYHTGMQDPGDGFRTLLLVDIATNGTHLALDIPAHTVRAPSTALYH